MSKPGASQKIYGTRPLLADMVKRAQRDGFDASKLVPVEHKVHGKNYYVRAWGLPSDRNYRKCTSWDYSTSPPTAVYTEQPGYLIYELRRDGRIQCNGRPVPDSDVRIVERKPIENNGVE